MSIAAGKSERASLRLRLININAIIAKNIFCALIISNIEKRN